MYFIEKLLEGKRVLVTGGTGSVGQAIIPEILKYNPEVLRVLDIDETREFEMSKKLKNFSNIRFLLGDVREKDRLSRAMEDIDIVFHLAALKHVLACEYNPFEAVKTNIFGTQNLIDVALEKETSKVIFASSDKAVNPCNVMGATKLLAERLITAANFYKGHRNSVFCSVRFGNVIGSRGSIIPLFKEQLHNGESITVTDEKMTRFIMPVSQSVNLLLKAAQLAQGGEVFVTKMDGIRILDLAQVIVEDGCGQEAVKDKIRIVGRGPGEKLFEEIMTQSESERSLETDDLFIILPEITEYSHVKVSYPTARPILTQSYSSDNVRILTKQEIKQFLVNCNIYLKNQIESN